MTVIELRNLLSFVGTEDEKLRRRHDRCVSESEVILARTVKLGEEFGELCEEVLACNSLQRQQKLDNHHTENLPEEFADVIVTTLLLAKAMNVNIEKAIEKKMQKLSCRV